MRRRVLIGAGSVVVAAAAVWGGIAVADDDDLRELERTVVAKPIVAKEAGPVTRAGGARIQTFYVATPVDPPENGGTVIGPKCPRKAGDAIGGGASTGQGIVVSYLSQLHPNEFTTRPRIYYVGVDDNSTVNDVETAAVVEVQCAKGLTVRK